MRILSQRAMADEGLVTLLSALKLKTVSAVAAGFALSSKPNA